MVKTEKQPTQRSARRRAVLRGLAALAASGWLPPSMAQGGVAMASTAFSATVRAYTGYAFDDPVVANAMLKALNGSVGNANIARIAALAASTPPEQLDAALKSAGLENAAEVVVVALYSGTVDTPKGTVVISYDQALVWQACGWTKPNGFCGGPTNYWATAPTGVTS